MESLKTGPAGFGVAAGHRQIAADENANGLVLVDDHVRQRGVMRVNIRRDEWKARVKLSGFVAWNEGKGHALPAETSERKPLVRVGPEVRAEVFLARRERTLGIKRHFNHEPPAQQPAVGFRTAADSGTTQAAAARQTVCRDAASTPIAMIGSR